MDAWLFLIGSAGATATNITFIYVLIKFPAFLRHVKAEGAEPDVVVRLSSFYEYNVCIYSLRVSDLSLIFSLAAARFL